MLHLRAHGVCRDLVIRMVEGGTLAFEMDEDPVVGVSLRTPTVQEREMNGDREEALVQVSATWEPDATLRDCFVALSENRLPADSGEPDVPRGDYFSPGGATYHSLYVLPLYLMPPKFQEFVILASDRLHGCAAQVVDIIRWRHGFGGKRGLISLGSIEWSLDGESWRRLPCNLGGTLTHIPCLRLSSAEAKREIEEVNRLAARRDGVPLGHELHAEAWVNRRQHPRSALIMGITALEVTVKNYIAELVPHAEWLALNLPTPPVAKMLYKYLPNLPAPQQLNGRVVFPFSESKVSGWVNLRNKVAHGGELPPGEKDLEELLAGVRDLIWMLDYYRGCPWALDHLSDAGREAVRAVMKQPPPPDIAGV